MLHLFRQRTSAGQTRPVRRGRKSPGKSESGLTRQAIRAHNERRDQGEQCSHSHDSRGIIACETGYELFTLRLACIRIFYQIEDFRNSRFSKCRRRTDMQNTREIQASADNGIAFGNLTRKAFTGQRRRVESRLPEIIFPSNGIFSPGFTTMILPTGHPMETPVLDFPLSQY